MLLEGEAEHVWGDGVYGKSLCFSLSFVVNLKLFKKKNLKKKDSCSVPGYNVIAVHSTGGERGTLALTFAEGEKSFLCWKDSVMPPHALVFHWPTTVARRSGVLVGRSQSGPTH